MLASIDTALSVVTVKDKGLTEDDLLRVREGTGAHCREEGEGNLAAYNKLSDHGSPATSFCNRIEFTLWLFRASVLMT